MEYKDMIKKIAKMHDHYTDKRDGLTCSKDCPLNMGGGCMAWHSPAYLASDESEGMLDDIDRIATGWVKPVDWEAVSEHAKTEDVKVLVWNNDTYNKLPRYLASYNADLKMFETFDYGTTRWSAKPDNTTWWEHAELVEEE